MDDPKPIGVATLSRLALQDYAETFDHTAHAWGWEQAERYADMLDRVMQSAAENPVAGRPVTGLDGVRAVFTKWPRAKYGHNIIYQTDQNGIYVLRILHSAMDLNRRLQEE